ncbi:MAG: response regulator transcription factor [Ectothiorhodospiraceae bacterium]|nr:response regulator transcription factor [Ectothiorhodospiraceae bacterium]
MKQFLVVEDNYDIANLVSMHLQDLGAEVQLASDGNVGLSLAQKKRYDLIILDLMLPGIDGLEICRRLRGTDNDTPILMLTAKSAELDRIVGLEMGADDYLPKPFSFRELVARAKAILRRAEARNKINPNDVEDLRAGDLFLDQNKRQATIASKVIDLTAREFDLLWHFATHPGQVFTRSQLLDSVWGYGHDGYEHTVNSHINRLRAKIENSPSTPTYILTVWGVGYKFSDTLSET